MHLLTLTLLTLTASAQSTAPCAEAMKYEFSKTLRSIYDLGTITLQKSNSPFQNPEMKTFNLRALGRDFGSTEFNAQISAVAIVRMAEGKQTCRIEAIVHDQEISL